MLSPTPWLIAAALTFAGPDAAMALCSYHGELYATTTLPQEFADSEWVVRVRVLSETKNWREDERDTFEGKPWTMYGLQVIEVFKGPTRDRLSLFTWQDSAGFYLDADHNGTDIDSEYLLFLNDIPMGWDVPQEAAGAMLVNYGCGQSRLWAEVAQADRMALATLAQSR